MKPTPTLIKALHTAAEYLETGGYYNWENAQCCNCGVLAQTILEQEKERKSSSKLLIPYLFAVDFPRGELWSTKADSVYCNTTGLSENKLFSILYEAGLETPEDFQEIEFLGLYNPKQEIFFECLTDKDVSFTKASYVAEYFRNKANLLESQLQNQQVKSFTPERVTVAA